MIRSEFRRSRLLAFLVLLFAPRLCCAALIITGQSRKVLVECSASDRGLIDQPPQLVLQAADFGPFTPTITRNAASGTAAASASSQQNSQITPLLISATGNLAIAESAGIINNNTGAAANAYILFDVFFTVDVPTPFTLTTNLAGILSGDGIGLIQGQIRLTNTFQTLLDRLFPDSGSQTIQGTLSPSGYELLAEFTLGATLTPSTLNPTSLTGNTNYSVNLMVPEPAAWTVLALGVLAMIRRRR